MQIDIKDVALITVPILGLVTSVLSYYGGKAQARNTNMGTVVLTADKINELVSKLMEAKMQIIDMKSDLSDCLRGKEDCIELKQKVTEINKHLETNAEEAIDILRSLKVH